MGAPRIAKWICPDCRSLSVAKVIDSRENVDGTERRRRYKMACCLARFTSIERIARSRGLDFEVVSGLWEAI